MIGNAHPSIPLEVRERDLKNVRRRCHARVYPTYEDYTFLLDKEHHDAEDRSTIEDFEKQLEKLLKEQNKITM